MNPKDVRGEKIKKEETSKEWKDVVGIKSQDVSRILSPVFQFGVELNDLVAYEVSLFYTFQLVSLPLPPFRVSFASLSSWVTRHTLC